jgi:hypothetical protein
MTEEERINALYVVDDKAAEMQKLIDEDNGAKLAYCSAKSLEERNVINQTSTKISNAADKLDINQLKKLSNEIEENQENYYDSFIKASMEFDSFGLGDSSYQSDPYANALQVKDELYKSTGVDFPIWNTFDPETGKMIEINEGYILQFKIDIPDSLPVYKYYQVKGKSDDGSVLNVAALNLSLEKNSAGEIIQTQFKEVHCDIPSSVLTNENSPYTIKSESTRYYSISDIVRAYRTDPTNIQSKINKMSTKPSKSTSGLDIAGIILGIILILLGFILILYGLCSIPVGGTIVGIGLGSLTAGSSILISSAIALSDWNKENREYSRDINIIESIIQKHNLALFDSAA